MNDSKLWDLQNILKYVFEIFELKSPNKMELSNFLKGDSSLFKNNLNISQSSLNAGIKNMIKAIFHF